MLGSWKVRAAAAAALVVLVGGCGGDDGGSGGDGPIKIGVITSRTGPFSVLGGFVKSTGDLMVDDLNRRGGIDGREVELVYEDDHTDPTQAAEAARSLARRDDIAALIGPISSSSCAAVIDTVEQQQVPMVTTCASQSQVEPVRRFTFMSTLATPAQIDRLTEYLAAEGLRRVALLYDDTDFGAAGRKALERLAGERGIDIVAQEKYSLEGSTFVPQLNAARRANPDAILAWGAGPPLVTIAKEHGQLGIDEPLVMSAAAATPLFLGPAGKAADGITMASSAANVIDSVPAGDPIKPVVTELAAAHEKRYGKPISQFAADVCGAFRVLVDAIGKAGADRAAIRDAIERTPVVGCHGRYRYSARDHSGLAPRDVRVVRVRDGGLEPTGA